jgi:hypothetical protein
VGEELIPIADDYEPLRIALERLRKAVGLPAQADCPQAQEKSSLKFSSLKEKNRHRSFPMESFDA